MTWNENVTDYLRLRRQLGARLAWPEHLLHQFATHLTAAGIEVITVTEAITWCSLLPAGVTAAPRTRASSRMTAVRGFADYMHALDPIHEIPPRGIFAGPLHREGPYLYCSAEITAVIRAAATLEGGSRAQTLPGVVCAAGGHGTTGRGGPRTGQGQRRFGCRSAADQSGKGARPTAASAPPDRQCRFRTLRSLAR